MKDESFAEKCRLCDELREFFIACEIVNAPIGALFNRIFGGSEEDLLRYVNHYASSPVTSSVYTKINLADPAMAYRLEHQKFIALVRDMPPAPRTGEKGAFRKRTCTAYRHKTSIPELPAGEKKRIRRKKNVV